MAPSTDLEVRDEYGSLPIVRMELSVDQLAERVEMIDKVRARLMKDDVHFGVIPGTGDKATLLKAGAEMLCEAFLLAPHFRTEKTWLDDGHLDVTTLVTIHHIPTGAIIVFEAERGYLGEMVSDSMRAERRPS